MQALALGELMKSRMEGYKKENSGRPDTSIEATERKPKGKIPEQGAIPDAIDQLIDNKMYRRRYLKLIGEGFLPQLCELARIARETAKQPNRYFAKSCKLTHWEDTLKKMNKILEAAKVVAEVVRKLPRLPLKIAQKAFWKKGQAALLDAITAAEIAKGDPNKFFCWLVWSPNRKQFR